MATTITVADYSNRIPQQSKPTGCNNASASSSEFMCDSLQLHWFKCDFMRENRTIKSFTFSHCFRCNVINEWLLFTHPVYSIYGYNINRLFIVNTLLRQRTFRLVTVNVWWHNWKHERNVYMHHWMCEKVANIGRRGEIDREKLVETFVSM